MEFEIDIYTPEYHEQVLHVLRSELWSFRTEAESRKLFQWKYLDNPFTKTAAGCVAKYNGRVVSFFGLFIQEYRLNDETFLCAVRSDASTLPEFQGKGIFKKLTQFSLDYFHNISTPPVRYITALSSNEASSAVYRKLGWQELGIKQMRYKISLPGIYHYLRKSFATARLPQTIQMKDYIVQIGYDAIGYHSIKHLLPTPANRIVRNISEPSWKWRYAHPLQKNIFCTVMYQGQIKAYLVLQQVVYNRYVLVDYFYDDKRMLAKGIKLFTQSLKPSDIQAWTIGKHPEELNDLRYCGFLNLEFITKHIKRLNPPPALIRPCVSQLQEKDWKLKELDIRQASNWMMNPIDSDIY